MGRRQLLVATTVEHPNDISTPNCCCNNYLIDSQPSGTICLEVPTDRPIPARVVPVRSMVEDMANAVV